MLKLDLSNSIVEYIGLFIVVLALYAAYFWFRSEGPLNDEDTMLKQIREQVARQAADLKVNINAINLALDRVYDEFRWRSGISSWYGKEFKGVIMANGKPFDPNAYTCSSNEFPLGTILLLHNPATKRYCLAEVTDRGGFGKYDRVLDVSEAVASYLQFDELGLAMLVYKPVASKDKPRARGDFNLY